MFNFKIIWRHYIITKHAFSMATTQRGKFIVFEGLDRSGKSTMTRLVSETLSSTSETLSIGFPNRTSKIGQMINEFLTNKVEMPNQAIHLLFSANRWENIKEIQENLKAGKNVVCDRYWYSGVAYSYAKGMNLDWCMSADEGLLEPDLVIFLKANPQTLSKRAGYGEQRFERVQFQEKVGNGFEKLMKRLNKDYFKVIEIQGKSIEEVSKDVLSTLDSLTIKNPE